SCSLSHVPQLLLTPPIPPLFPYTTLFRSARDRGASRGLLLPAAYGQGHPARALEGPDRALGLPARRGRARAPRRGHRCGVSRRRSEEHTSELQSRFDLVCRLLLENKTTK